jgi:hypothetical protein
LLPPIPAKLTRIDESTFGEHFSLEASDRCFYIWEYTAGRRYDFSPTNQLIKNLKIKPSSIAKAPKREFYKQQALDHAARALRSFVRRALVEERATFIPVPGSKAAGDPDHDPRMLYVLKRAFQGWSADIRPMLELTQSIPADHETSERIAFHDLHAVSSLNDTSGQPLRPMVVIVDDVLNSGKHFKVAQALIGAKDPNADVRGLFLARCIRDSLATADDFPDLDEAP